MRRLAAVMVAAFLAACAADAHAQETLAFTVPAAPWRLVLPKNAITVEEERVNANGRSGYFTMADAKTNVVISFFIEPVSMCGNSRACRDSVRARGNPSWQDPRQMSDGAFDDVSYFQFFMPSYAGYPVKQENLYAEFVQDGFWVDLHLSKVQYSAKDHALFEAIVKSIRFEAKTPPPAKED
jgi:hypothetical protein